MSKGSWLRFFVCSFVVGLVCFAVHRFAVEEHFNDAESLFLYLASCLVTIGLLNMFSGDNFS